MTDLRAKIEKLPKWARSHIEKLARDRDEATRQLNKYLDNQTQSGIYTEDFALANGSFHTRRNYVQSNIIHITGNDVALDVHIARSDDGQRSGIELTWRPNDRRLGDIALIPKSYQQAQLVSKKDMR